MQTKVNIIADDMGNVIRQSSTNSEFGHVRLQQERVTFGNTGWVKKSVLSTLLHGKLEDLQRLALLYKIDTQKMGTMGKKINKLKAELYNELATKM